MNNFTKKLFILTEQNETYQKLVESYNLPNLVITKEAREAHIVLAAPPLLAPKLNQFEKLVWVQSIYAGIDALIKDSLRQDYLLTNVKGIFGQQIAEYVLGLTIDHYRHFNLYREQQRQQQWLAHSYQTLSSKTMVIVGTGEIGSYLAQMAKAFGLITIGVNTRGIPKTNSPFDYIYHIDELASAIGKADIVVSTLPETPSTQGIFNQTNFSQASSILFFNVGRGSSIEQTALLAALDSGKVAQAFLDVFEQEPLPSEHPYWAHPNVTITPHIAAVSFPEQVVKIFADHYIEWEQGYSLHGCIDFSKGY
ncbi:D-2-hydroxyacid dehydrogenase [Vibrio panuliri]|uniref:2-ketoacid reductase n=1 Tax=Vibrio panuliri TaxID=1381081 RepID=A0ABX3FT74_9VIBR|nr:D-2-hydroxyacid dehydrogenase [Vibrio panuliri]KAB1459533.1 D-2-hydroxyacid dehydrogenase [Vibrio panuliri]OLQ96202.1 2-ketoacid reductase [Vibrio panuliri]